ncbi:alpha/beta hydrolase [Amycolatopsis anabasis]|uniref:alpha/beta hydrolase n=1 Tax=Amycolatopsis anabasis TaxID=1840409 RepID=UPI00131BE392|nr:alpha/beta hydrolase [Amycolatopsis anabasis]
MTNPTTRFTVSQRMQRTLAIGLGRVPHTLLRRIAKPPVNTAGEEMAPEIALLMSATAKADDYSDLAPADARAAVETESILFAERLGAFEVEEEVVLADGLLGTRYRAGREARGLILFFHGGGFVLGSRASYETPAKLLALESGAEVLSVEYRLAPEHPFPAAHEDALAAWEYAVAQAPQWGIDPRRIVVAGDSAGGNIAAVLSQHLRGRKIEPLLQVLIYPVVDVSTRRPSHDEFESSPALTAKQLEWFTHHYLASKSDRSDPRVSPLLAAGLAGVAPAVIVVAGFDPLRDEGEEYAAALLRAGVSAEVLREGGLVHGFISFTAISRTSKLAVERIARTIGKALQTAGTS